MLIKIADYFNVSIDYLLGHNIGIAYSEKETEILRIFRTFDDFQQDIFIEQGRAVMKVILLNKSPILSAED